MKMKKKLSKTELEIVSKPPKAALGRSEEVTDRRLQRWSRLLKKADNDPASVLDDPRCLKPQFLAQFFDLCDGKALEAPWAAADYADVALQLAEKTGDAHTLNTARGIAAHALIGNTRWSEAADLLRFYREEASACCSGCISDWLRRQGDLLAETRDAEHAAYFLGLSATVLGEAIDDDSRGRILFVRGLANYYADHRAQALEDIDDALQLLSLSAPRGYFMDSIAFVACFLQKCDERHHYETARAVLTRFRDRLKGLKGWGEVRDRLRWTVAIIEAWLGHPRRARAALARARTNHLKHSPHRYVLAISLDEALVACMHSHLPHVHVRSFQRMLKACKQNLKLEENIRRSLRQTARSLGESPWHARRILAQCRRSFIVPVPALLAADTVPRTSARARKADAARSA